MSLHSLTANSGSFVNNKLSLIPKFLQQTNIHHSWLIYGNEGIGKSSLIYKLINQLLENNSKINKDYYHPDLLIIDKSADKKEISVDSIRKVNQFLSLTPLQSRFRIVLIDNCNYLNTNAANALLKILEEPPKNSLIFLISHTIGKIPHTILSRCIKLYIHNLTYKNSLELLLSLQPNIHIDDAKKLLFLSHASTGLALELYNINALENYKEFITLIDNIINTSIKQIWKWLDQAGEWKFFSLYISHFMATLLKNASNIENINYINEDEKRLSNFLCQKTEVSSLIELYEFIQSLLNECYISNLDQKQVTLTIFNKFRNIML